MNRRWLVAAALPLSIAIAAPAFAKWGATGSGSANAVAATLSAPGKPETSGTVTASSVPLSWTAGSGVSGTIKYHVERAAFGGSNWTDVCSSTDAAPISGTSCTDNSVSGSSDYQYRVTGEIGGWRATSAISDKISTPAALVSPVVAISIPTANTDYANNGAMNNNCDSIASGVTGICGTYTPGSGTIGASGITLTIQRTVGATVTYWTGSSWSASSSSVTATKTTTGSKWSYALSYSQARTGVTNNTLATYSVTVTITDSNSKTGTATRSFTTH